MKSIEKSFEKIYNDNSDRIFGFIYRMSNDKMLAEELTQETFYRAFISFSKFKGNSSIFTWLASIAKYTYFSYMKKNRMLNEAVSFDSMEELGETLSDTDDSGAEADVIKKELYHKLNELLQKLPDKYRDAVLYRTYADMSFKQVAQLMDITESSAKVLFYRAKNMLREGLENEFEL